MKESAVRIRDEVQAQLVECRQDPGPHADPRCVNCLTPLRYESTAHGIQHWRCPTCGNAHWWPESGSG